MSDCIHRFLFEKLDVRGAIVQLDASWQAMQHDRGYCEAVRDLLGQTAVVSILIGSQLKTPGRLTLQVQGKGPVSLLVVDCDESLRLRGMARADKWVAPAAAPELIGDGRLLLSLQTAQNRHPYQSYVPLEGNSIAAIFENYLRQSEQQPTRLWLFADGERASGLFLQTMPPDQHRANVDEDGWNRVQQLAATVRADEFSLPAQELARRLFAEEDVRLFDPQPVVYHCPRDEQKVRSMLQSLGRAEIEKMIAEQGEIVIRDDICNHEYRFGPEIATELFPPGGQTLH